MPHDWSSAIIFAKKSKFLKETLGQDLHKAVFYIFLLKKWNIKNPSTVSED